ncbi:GTP-binding protein [Pseudomaricurvus alcaniphilus]|uniref:CobW family GTP-binding protein n=1 Tax=Pseudomaricurvus alcaniphilus TaxID=1166482 RepID=UPI001409720E|nr:GTP-binding protein [Pseudomaricurvus alcaniphilus]NHN38181.1 GTP-binding protein [Pseudomaricurvus alcaniphilus]
MSALKAIPTNVITGFLGVGKSTAILNLLKQKPDNERWAVLVNEFGEVGIDGSLFTGQKTEEAGIFIREVPGGCMCCAAGLPMQIALNMLLARAKPQRLLIEPTGLGHPLEVLSVLVAEHYREVVDLRATITLVDARKVHDERYTTHPTFNQQLAIADVIVANKADQYHPGDFPALLGFLERTTSLDSKSIFQVSMGALKIDWLAAPASQHIQTHHHHTEKDVTSIPEAPEIPETGYLSIDNEGEGFYSRGWIFKPEWIFNSQELYNLLLGVNVERIKAVFITDQGITAYNKADNVLTEAELDDSMDSRIECISSDRCSLESLEDALLACVRD